MMILLTCDQKLTKSQFSPTHASTKRKITEELKLQLTILQSVYFDRTIHADGPKFINCDGLEVRRRLYEKDVSVECDIQAQPVVDSVRVQWTQSPTQNISLTAGRRDGHYVVLLQPTNTSARIHSDRNDCQCLHVDCCRL